MFLVSVKYCKVMLITPVEGEGGGHPYKRDCKLQICVSLKVFGMESHDICPFRYRLGLCIKKCKRNAMSLISQKSYFYK